MATLVFSAIGTALGGPVGSAIGALVGQSIDQQLLAPVRRGPRVGDLAVQTSSYGTPIPKIYGTMRVAGSVIWSTDLIETATSDGAKGQPDVAYSYTVSLAVALSSRPVKSIKRIWADGKLIRGVAGDFKVGTTFRFHEGGEDQAVDPLIAASEGIGLTPAYRGLAMCVFEELELAAFGNRIPFFTFEVEADGEPQSIGAILGDASDGLIDVDEERMVAGYAAYGQSIKDAVEPLIEAFGVALFDNGGKLTSSGGAAPSAVTADELGNSADGKAVGNFERERASARSLPASLRLTHYDPARDYQTGAARSSIGEPGSEAQRDLPAVLSADDAKGLADEILARAWGERDRLTLRLPTARMGCEPGMVLTLPLIPTHWRVQRVTIEAFVTVVELYPITHAATALVADSGRIAGNPDVVMGALTLALLEIPDQSGTATGPKLLLAASGAGEGWRVRPVELDIGGLRLTTSLARAKAVLGSTMSALGSGTTFLLDEDNTIDVQLVDDDQWLTSCDADALAAGANAAVIGKEIVQFGRAEPLGSGKWRLSRLSRGRAGTDWACDAHVAGETFCMLHKGSIQAIDLPLTSVGGNVEATAADANASTRLGGETLRPIAPVQLFSSEQDDGGILVRWTRRSRVGFAWIDGVDAPLGEAREQYRVIAESSSQTLEFSSDEPSLHIDSEALAALGSGPISLTVQQVGDYGVSHPAQIIFN